VLGYLEKLITNKKNEVTALKQDRHLLNVVPRRSNKSFKAALAAGHAVIAEIKRRSPSKSHLATIADPVALARHYVDGGAVAVSVLTDSFGFGGSIEDLKNIAEQFSKTPVVTLRKDFIIDEIQIAEAVLAGADAVLLIVAVLKEQTADLLAVAKAMNIDALVEVMSQKELDYALSLELELIVVNNRDLTTFEVDTSRAFKLRATIPDSVITVAASGIKSPKMVLEYFTAGYHAVLVGEALVKSDDPSQFIQECCKR